MAKQNEIRLFFEREGSFARLIRIDGEKIEKSVHITHDLVEVAIRPGITVGLEVCRKSRKTLVRVLDRNGKEIQERAFKRHWTCRLPVHKLTGFLSQGLLRNK